VASPSPNCSPTPPPGRSPESSWSPTTAARFQGHAFAAYIASRPELLHIRTRRKSPGQNGVRERAFGSLKYEHLYRMEIETLPDLHREAEAYRQIFNHLRPHEARGFYRPIGIHRDPALQPQPNLKPTETQPSAEQS